MAHFAKVVDGVVEQVIVADSADWCATNLGGTWIQTSYNTYAGEHKLGGSPLRKNYAGIGYTYDGIGFAAPQPFLSWILNQDTYIWEAPTPQPTDVYTQWNEETQAWEPVELPNAEQWA